MSTRSFDLLQPEGDALSAIDALAAAESDVDIIELLEPREPRVGRSWLLDFESKSFVTASNGGPVSTNGEATLHQWAEKALRTEQGSYDIHPELYGLEGLRELIGASADDPALADAERRIRSALLMHPRIVEIEDYNPEYDPENEALYVSFVMVTDEGSRIPMEIGI